MALWTVEHEAGKGVVVKEVTEEEISRVPEDIRQYIFWDNEEEAEEAATWFKERIL